MSKALKDVSERTWGHLGKGLLSHPSLLTANPRPHPSWVLQGFSSSQTGHGVRQKPTSTGLLRSSQRPTEMLRWDCVRPPPNTKTRPIRIPEHPVSTSSVLGISLRKSGQGWRGRGGEQPWAWSSTHGARWHLPFLHHSCHVSVDPVGLVRLGAWRGGRAVPNGEKSQQAEKLG